MKEKINFKDTADIGSNSNTKLDNNVSVRIDVLIKFLKHLNVRLKIYLKR